MTISIDPREKRQPIIALHNGPLIDGKRPLLEYRREDNPDAAYSYDVRIDWEGGASKGEIKQHGDAKACWMADTLGKQLEAVDFFIVEIDPFLVAAETPDGKEEAAAYRRINDNFEKHLADLSLRMPVIRTTGIRHTAMVLQHLDATQGGTIVRGNSVRGRSEDPRMGLLASMPGINPFRVIDKPESRFHGSTVGDAIWSFIDPETLRIAFNVDSWREIPGIGPAAIAKVLRALSKPEAPDG